MPQPNNRAPVSTSKKSEPTPAEHMLIRIIALIDEIIILMNEEIPLVEGRKRSEHAELLKRKQRLTLDYRASLKAIVLDPNMLRQVPEELRLKARDAANRLAEASGRNARTLRAIMTASQRLVQSIVALVKEEVLPQIGYSNMQAGHSVGSYSPTCKPVTVFRSA
jgi:hypothetical protein